MSATENYSVFISSPRVSYEAFLGVTWGNVAITTVFLLLRLGARLRHFKRLFLDDAFIILAWSLNLATAIICQRIAPNLYALAAFLEGKPPESPVATFISNTELFFKASTAVVVFFYTTLWAVKFGFLVFFRRLSHNVAGQKRLWWSVASVTGAAYIVCLGTSKWKCLAGPLTWIAIHCASPDSVKSQLDVLKVYCVLDVVTDYLIMIIPFNMLRKTRISLRKKLALSGIFSLAVIITISAIIRVALITGHSNQLNVSWLYTWSMVEQGISIIVACTASFTQLFRAGPAPSRHQPAAAPQSFLTISREAIRRARRTTRPSESSLILGETDEEAHTGIATRGVEVSSVGSPDNRHAVMEKVVYPRTVVVRG